MTGTIALLETLKPGEALKKALATAKFDQILDPWMDKADKLMEIERDIIKCQTAIEQLLPMEADAKQVLMVKLSNLKTLRRQITYPKLSLEPFTWRNTEGFPIFAIFNINGGEFRISEDKLGLQLPAPIKNNFIDVSTKLERIHYHGMSFGRRWTLGLIFGPVLGGMLGLTGWAAHGLMAGSPNPCPIPWYVHPIALVIGFIGSKHFMGSYELAIVARYMGVMPNRVRLRVEELQKDFDSIYVLAEVPKWEIEKVAQLLLDPLVLGFADNAFYLLDAYDTTPIEGYVRQEFTS